MELDYWVDGFQVFRSKAAEILELLNPLQSRRSSHSDSHRIVYNIHKHNPDLTCLDTRFDRAPMDLLQVNGHATSIESRCAKPRDPPSTLTLTSIASTEPVIEKPAPPSTLRRRSWAD